MESDNQIATPICDSNFVKDYLEIRTSSSQLQPGIQLGETEKKLYQRVYRLNESCVRFKEKHPFDEEC